MRRRSIGVVGTRAPGLETGLIGAVELELTGHGWEVTATDDRGVPVGESKIVDTFDEAVKAGALEAAKMAAKGLRRE